MIGTSSAGFARDRAWLLCPIVCATRASGRTVRTNSTYGTRPHSTRQYARQTAPQARQGLAAPRLSRRTVSSQGRSPVGRLLYRATWLHCRTPAAADVRHTVFGPARFAPE